MASEEKSSRMANGEAKISASSEAKASSASEKQQHGVAAQRRWRRHENVGGGCGVMASGESIETARKAK